MFGLSKPSWFARRRTRAAGWSSALCVLALASATEATTFVVNTLADAGPGSLRQAILDANAAAGDDEISFGLGVAGRIELVSPLPTIEESLEIIGPGPGLITIDANRSGRVLRFSAGGGTLSLSKLTLTGGLLPPSFDDDGAGIYVDFGDTLFGEALQIVDNQAPTGRGGGVYGAPSSLVEIVTSNISDNEGVVGGGVAGANVRLSFSALVRNEAKVEGGAVSVNSDLELYNTTISSNTAASTFSASFGGGVNVQNGGDLTMVHSAVVNNRADSGGGIHVWPSGTVSQVSASYLSANQFLGTGNPNNCNQGLGQVDQSNLEDHDDCGFVGTSDFEDTDAQVFPLGGSGSATEFHLPLATSPLLDAAPSVSCPSLDQRGTTRPIDGDGVGGAECDIGPVELQPGLDGAIFYDGFETGDLDAWLGG